MFALLSFISITFFVHQVLNIQILTLPLLGKREIFLHITDDSLNPATAQPIVIGIVLLDAELCHCCIKSAEQNLHFFHVRKQYSSSDLISLFREVSLEMSVKVCLVATRCTLKPILDLIP